MTEEFLHFVWKYGLFDRTALLADTGEPVEVIRLGQHNPDAGPDFLNARIRIGGTLWAGNVELHLRSSDWFAHGHHTDPAYDNVILHVVHQYNRIVTRTDAAIIPSVRLPVGAELYERYRTLISRKGRIACEDRMPQTDPFIRESWLHALAVERLSEKAGFVTGLLQHYRGDWEETLYVALARAFGFGINATPFEMTARALPLAVVRKHSHNRLQTEALLMGQAGFLKPGQPEGGYAWRLHKEYQYLAAKYGLTPIDPGLWKFLRMRPMNFPTVRLAMFAELMHTPAHFSQLIACHEIAGLRTMFSIGAHGFWNVHYTFEKVSESGGKMLGEEAFQSIVINAVIPVLFQYGNLEGKEELKERALAWLGSLPAEHNRIVADFARCGLGSSSALHSQAVLQLWKMYCSRKRCLSCSLGSQWITSGG